MNLNDKLTSISKDETVPVLNEMLQNAHVSISSYGRRIVSIDGFEGSVEINTLALKYLQANAFQADANPSIRERLDCYALWERVRKLYQDSDDELNKMGLFKYLTLMREFRPYCRECGGDPLAIICEWETTHTRDSLFNFPVKEYQSMWPGVEPQVKSRILGGGEDSERWLATKEMVESFSSQ